MLKQKGLLLAVSLLAASFAQGADLWDIYQRALESDPLLREAEANRLAALEIRPQARSALLPQIGFSASRSRNERDGSNSFPQAVGNSIVIIDTTRETTDDTDQYALQLTQTLFRWDQVIALKQADKAVAQAELDFESARQDLMVRSAQRYFDVLAAKDTVESADATRKAISRQLEQAEKRFEVGLIAITDVREAQAAFDEATAGVIQAKRALATARENLREITGEYYEKLAAPGEAMQLAAPDPSNIDEWVSTALEQNLAVRANQLAVQISTDEIKSRRTNRYPTVDLIATSSQFDQESDESFDGGADLPSSIDTDSTNFRVQLNLPVYTGGFTSSRIKEAVYLNRAAKERLERIQRATERLARDAYLGVESEISRVIALARAVESSETALKATEAGFDVGTRTTVDVLDARRALFNAQTNFLRSRYDYIIEVLRLQFAAGTLNDDDFREISGWLE